MTGSEEDEEEKRGVLEESRGRDDQGWVDQADETGVDEGDLYPGGLGHEGPRDRQDQSQSRRGEGDDHPVATPTSFSASSRPRLRQGNLAQILSISKEALPSLLLSILSLMFSGKLLVHLSRWPAFVHIPKLFILIPILLNLKGNLEMNLSLRMSTSANIGELDMRRTRKTLVKGNMNLLQVQALIVSTAAGGLAFALGVLAEKSQGSETSAAAAAATTTATGNAATQATNTARALLPGAVAMVAGKLHGTDSASPSKLRANLSPRKIIQQPNRPIDPSAKYRDSYFEFVLVLATGMLSASFSSAILGHFVCALVIIARRFGVNPDNVASPLAASLGDLLTLTIMGLVGSTLTRFEGTVLASIIFVILLGACTVCFIFTKRNTYVRELLTSGWVPLIVAMFISSAAGLVLDEFVARFQGFALLVPVATGLPGACAAILVSRTSTALHAGGGHVSLYDDVHAGHSNARGNPSGATSSAGFVQIGASSRPSRFSPVHLFHTHVVPLFPFSTLPIEGWLVPLTVASIGIVLQLLSLLFLLLTNQLACSWPFLLFFTLFATVLCQFLGMWMAHTLTVGLWTKDWDPDIYALPYVSSLIDVAGQCLLVVAYAAASALGDVVKVTVAE